MESMDMVKMIVDVWDLASQTKELKNWFYHFVHGVNMVTY